MTGVVDEVTLVFLDPIRPGITLEVRDDRGDPVAGLGEPVRRQGGSVAAVRFDPLTDAGGYVVDTSFTALDGDTQRRTHRFTYEPPASAVRPLPAVPRRTEPATVLGMAAVAVVLVWSGVTALRRRQQGRTDRVAK